MTNKITPIEGKFPQKAVITQASATLNDMGDMSISMQVKIHDLQPDDFAYDWEVEFQGERYIHAIREPQASKGNDSICSTIDLTFQHWTIYQLRRYYFVEMSSIESGTAIADKYIATLGLNLKDFCVAFQSVLDYYYKDDDAITIDLKDPNSYDITPQYVEISYTHIWDVLQKIYEVYGVRWHIKGKTIYVGHPTKEVEHTFKYGFEGGLLKVERQVQSTDIRNSLLGRGGSKNLPYRYFKDVDEHNPSFKADPDWIPELANIYFSELRGKTFRDYVKGWKAKHYDGEPMAEPTEAYTKGYTDTTFNPIEFVEDKKSIDKYGLLQGGLENQEDIYPSIQGIEVDGIGRIDEVVGVEEVTVDEVEGENVVEDTSLYTFEVKGLHKQNVENIDYNSTIHCTFQSEVFTTNDSNKSYFATKPSVSAKGSLGEQHINCYNTRYEKCSISKWRGKYNLQVGNVVVKVFYAKDNQQVTDIIELKSGESYYCIIDVDVYGFPRGTDNLEYNALNNTWNGYEREMLGRGDVTIEFSWILESKPINGIILGNYESGTNISINSSLSIDKGETKFVILKSGTFVVPENGATNVDVPINIITSQDAQGLYEWQRASIQAVNVDTNEVVSSINIPQGAYYLRVKVEITNNSSTTQTYKVELMPSYIYFPTDVDAYKPTFDIWIKNIWNTTRNDGESDVAYVDRVWTPILGDREGESAKVVFTTGLLSGHSDYEFEILDVAYAGNEGVLTKDDIPAEWRLTLAKSTAELEATGKYIPSTQIQAKEGDFFYFIGIDMPHQYVLWAEERLDQCKQDKLLETSNIKPTWVVQTDKVRLNQLQPNEANLLLDALKVGNTLRLADNRFISAPYELLYLQSVTYSWGADTLMLPNVEVVLSDKVATSLNTVAQIQGQIDTLTKQVGSISNVQQVVRAVGDKLYLRKDGVEDTSNSTTMFSKGIQSNGYRQGSIGGQGWGLRTEQGKGILELDKLVVRDEMQVNSLVINQVASVGGKEILSAANIVCTRVETTAEGFVCYFDQKRGSIANLFVVGDIAYSQVFDAKNQVIKYYKRIVVATSDNSITLSLDGDGDGAPQEGDVIVQYGNTTENERQYVIIRDVIGGGYERMLSELNSVDAVGVEYYFAGRMEGETPRWFVGDRTKGYAEWKDDTFTIKGKLEVGSDVGGATVVEGGLVTAETISLGSGDTIKAGITGKGEGNNAIRIWAGAIEGNKAKAPFRVTQDGKLYATNAEVEGRVNAGSTGSGDMVIENGTISVTSFDTKKELMTLDGTGLGVTTENNSYAIVGYTDHGIDEAAMVNISVSDLDDTLGYPVSALHIGRGRIKGLRYTIRRVDTDGYIGTMDTVIRNTSNTPITLQLPEGAEDGQMYVIIGGTSTTLTISGNNKIKSYGTDFVDSFTFQGDYTKHIIYDAVGVYINGVQFGVWHVS